VKKNYKENNQLIKNDNIACKFQKKIQSCGERESSRMMKEEEQEENFPPPFFLFN